MKIKICEKYDINGNICEKIITISGNGNCDKKIKKSSIFYNSNGLPEFKHDKKENFGLKHVR